MLGFLNIIAKPNLKKASTVNTVIASPTQIQSPHLVPNSRFCSIVETLRGEGFLQNTLTAPYQPQSDSSEEMDGKWVPPKALGDFLIYRASSSSEPLKNFKKLTSRSLEVVLFGILYSVGP